MPKGIVYPFLSFNIGENMLKVRNITKTYQSGEIAVMALGGVSFDVAQGEMVSIMGKSGSGKTTLLNIIGGLLTPDGGSVTIGNIEITGLSDKRRTVFRRENIGLVFQFFNLVQELSAKDNIILASQLSRLGYSESYYQKLISLLGLKERESHLPSQLSGGERQRVAIARALITQPKLLLLDEPTGNLDTESAKMVMDMLKTIRNELGTTVITVTHDLDVARYGNRIITLKNGALVQ